MGGRVLRFLPLIEAGRQYVSIPDQHRSYRDLLCTKGVMGHVEGHAHEMTITGLIRSCHGHVKKLCVLRSGLRENSFSEWPKKW